MKILLALLSFTMAVSAQDGFSQWWPQFQAAVKSGNAKTVAAGADFPMDWENGPVRQIKTQADFLVRFTSYFTADMKSAVAAKKPEHLPNGQYMITWKARGNEYSMYFKPSGSAFALNGLSEGPP